jgi:hypothetical protein
MNGMDRSTGRFARTAAAALVALGLAASPASAVVILDSTWKAEGGAKGRETAGFKAHLKLAAEPQFRAVLALSTPDGAWGEASGTWIGNVDGHAWILTAGHIFELPGSADDYVVLGPKGETLKADRLVIHPKWNGDTETRTGYDLALIRLKKPIEGLGEPPLIHAGGSEAGKLLTFVGYGNRGIGSKGEQAKFYEGSDKAAARGVVDQFVDPAGPKKKKGDLGNWIGVFLPKEDGSVENPYGGSNKPADRMVGLLGSGDSGGSAWLEIGGQWRIVGINSNGSGKAQYGDSSWFARVAPHRDWIAGHVPTARFAE